MHFLTHCSQVRGFKMITCGIFLLAVIKNGQISILFVFKFIKNLFRAPVEHKIKKVWPNKINLLVPKKEAGPQKFYGKFLWVLE